MIVAKRIWIDFVLHSVITLLLFSAFQPRFKLSYKHYIGLSLFASLLVTIINHTFFPQFKLRYTVEGFQECQMRWGNKPYDCPFKDTCPHKRLCAYNRGEGLNPIAP
jgi:hypothetical protein